MVTKLSQIAAAGSAPALTDQLVGVGGGTTDHLYTVAQLQSAIGRTILTANANYYVNSATGSDSNPGTSGSPFATLQYAWDHLSGTLDLAEFSINLHCQGAGPYTLQANSGWIGGADVNILGDGVSVTTTNDMLFANLTSFTLGPNINIDDVTMNDGGSGFCVQTFAFGAINLGAGGSGSIAFGPASVAQINTTNYSNIVLLANSIQLNAGTSTYYIWAVGLSFVVDLSGGTTVVGTPAYTQFIRANELGLFETHAGFTGSATGTRFLTGQGGQIKGNVIGGSPTFFPGDADGWTLPGTYSSVYQTTTSAPTTGNTVQLSSSQPSMVLKPAGTLATLTLDLPNAASLSSNQGDNFTSSVISTQNITALTVTATGGSSVVGAPTSLTAHVPVSMHYSAVDDTWYRAV